MKLYSKKYGIFTVLLCYFLFFQVLSLDAQNSDKQYLNSLIEKTRMLSLSKKKYWHILLHYKKSFSGVKSLIDDPAFFFSPNGKYDPQAELEATLRAFFSKSLKNKMHPSMKFIARFSWLKKELDFDVSYMPVNPLEKFHTYLKNNTPVSVSIVFPTGYIDSPASMFGHTLLIIDSENKSKLTSMAVNYAAKTNEGFGPVFAIKGLFGLYKGYFSFLPFYDKIAEYNNGEMRDIWEYKLNFTKDEVYRLVMHMIELENIYSYYYFIDENCSYNLLFLLEAARPELSLSDQFLIATEPIETIRAVLKQNIVIGKEYWPSLYSKIQHLKSQCSSDEIDVVMDVTDGTVSPDEIDKLSASSDKKALLYDLSIEYLQFLAQEGSLTKKQYTKRFLGILTMRNQLDPALDYFQTMNKPAPPESGHFSHKLGISGGMINSSPFTQINFRYNYHELMDVDDGFIKNSEISFGNFYFRYYSKEEKVTVHKINIIDVISLSPSDSFITKGNWKLLTGFEQKYNSNGNEQFTYYLNTGGGMSTIVGPLEHLYSFFEIYSNFASEYDYNTDLGSGGKIGLVTSIGMWKSHLYGASHYFFLGEKHWSIKAGIQQRFAINSNSNILFDFYFNRDYDFIKKELMATLNFYF